MMFAPNALLLAAAAGFAAAQTTITNTVVNTTTATNTVPVTSTLTGSETTTITSLSTLTTSYAASNSSVIVTTRVVDAYTTFCPYATVLTYQGKPYTVNGPTTLTITDCPCTVVEPCHTCHAAQPTGVVPPPKGGNAGNSSSNGYQGGGKPGNQGGNSGKTCNGSDCPSQVNGAGAFQVSLGMAAALGLLVL